MIFQLKAKILYNKKAGHKYRHMSIIAPKIAGGCLPGQFLNIKIDSPDLLLRRPFSIHRVSRPKIEILYEVIGQGTKILSQKKPGDFLDVIGPLGNGFNYSLFAARYPLLIAGGMGVAPLVFLAEELISRKPQAASRKPLILIGAKSKKDILCAEEFKKFGCALKIATDDGSRGFKGKVTELLQNILLKTANRIPITVYACGPRPMLRQISRFAQKYDIPAQISLEEYLACGIGACLGCAVKTTQGLKRVCKEGPVFDTRRIIWQREE